jgi:uncharacterized membrane protein
MKPKEFLAKLDSKRIVAAIASAEEKTSGEIRVFVSMRDVEEPKAAAEKHFAEMGMAKTRHHNGVLLFFAPKARKFAVIGDSGVHEKCGDPFWEELVGRMSGFLRQEQFTEAIMHGVEEAGRLLASHFPPEPDDSDELPNDIVVER